MSDPLRPTLGLVAGKYEVLQLIGRGGMGSVWEGRHVSLGTRVAIKFVDTEHAESEEARARFVTEARAAATIRSKYAIQIHDHGVTDEGRPYIVMELLLGEPLDRRVDRLGRLTLAETARILAQVSRALQRAHDVGIIHRDLKPENIFIVRSSEDDDEIAKVLDFGIAKIKPPPGEVGLTSSTRTGAVLGTPYYMSPEQARGLRNIDHRTDLWSLGVIAYKCVTGALPFEGESVGDLLVKICTGSLPTPSRSDAGLPSSFDTWFFKALDREPAARFASARELSDHLSACAGIAVPRSPRSGGTEVVPELGSSQPSGASGLPGGGVTSPSVVLARSMSRPRGATIAAVGAALLAGSVGIATIARFVGSTPINNTADAEAASQTVFDAAPPALDAAPPDASRGNGAGPSIARPNRSPPTSDPRIREAPAEATTPPFRATPIGPSAHPVAPAASVHPAPLPKDARDGAGVDHKLPVAADPGY